VDSKQKQAYFKAFHTSPSELGEIATRARPKLLVLYHQVMGETTEEDLVEQVKQYYSGKFVSLGTWKCIKPILRVDAYTGRALLGVDGSETRPTRAH